MKFVTEMIKGSPEYRVEDGCGIVVARSHQVGPRFTIVVNGQWRGALPEADAVKYLKSLIK